MTSPASIKGQLQHRAIKLGRTFQDVLTLYGLERVLFRIFISPYRHHFVLKGGILLYAIFEGRFSRSTADVDLLGSGVPNDIGQMRRIFEHIMRIEYPLDGICFDLKSLRITRITEFRNNPGVNIKMLAKLDRTAIHIHIDIGFGDSVYPKIIAMEYPTLLDLSPPMIQAYSIESLIAEKFHAIIALGSTNSRMKDFYDIYILLNTYDFSSNLLFSAIKETFLNRKTSLATIVSLKEDMILIPNRQKMWNAFIKSNDLKLAVPITEVAISIDNFLLPLFKNERPVINCIWDHLACGWHK